MYLYVVGTKKVMGENHKGNSPKISHNFPRWQWDSIVGKAKPKKVLRYTQNAFKKLLQNFQEKNFKKKIIERIFWLTN